LDPLKFPGVHFAGFISLPKLVDHFVRGKGVSGRLTNLAVEGLDQDKAGHNRHQENQGNPGFGLE
jgi:hypothetical protein